jgi:hypothetical protein
MFTSRVNCLGPTHHQRGTDFEFYVLPATREGENPMGLVELLRALKSGEPLADSESGATEPSTPGPEPETEATDHPSQQSRRTLLNLKLVVALTAIAMFALPTATAFAGHF